MSSQRFCLRWNNHQSNLLSVFDQLLHAETFTDVTLAVEGQLLKAHKMVLSACSPYFQALFVNHQEKHPIVILKDVPYSDMKNLLDFMYRGEVSVDQERLTAFLKIAESLRIKGLTEVNEEKCDIPALTNSLLQQQAQNLSELNSRHNNQFISQQKRPVSALSQGSNPPNLLMPLLGNALLQPKRKRGRPRKLSGSSNEMTGPGSPGGEGRDSHLIRGSPELLEVRMGTDGFGDDGCTSGGEDGGEALLIDEGDDASNANIAQTPSKDCESADIESVCDDIDISCEHTSIITLDFNDLDKTSISRKTEFDTTNSENTIHRIDQEENDDRDDKRSNSTKADFHEYIMKHDGSVVCKLCGEILRSRTHWYRHKYKVHVMPNLAPTPLLQCEQCLVFFKSKKGFNGHMAAKHNDIFEVTDIKQEILDPEHSLPTSAVLNYNNTTQKTSDMKKNMITNKVSGVRCSEEESKGDWEKKRIKEEKLVADIIARVKKECEAQGGGLHKAARRGYGRRNTLTDY